MANKLIQLTDGVDNVFPKTSDMELIWQNSNPSSAFASQTVNLPNLSEYRFLIVTLIGYKDNPINKVTNIVRKGDGGSFYYFYNKDNNGWRTFSMGANNITFGDGYWVSSVDNAFIIPYQIYGVR